MKETNFKIGDLVNAPRDKVVGIITDKIYDINSEIIFKVLVSTDPVKTLSAYGSNLLADLEIDYYHLRSLKSTLIYNTKVQEKEEKFSKLLNKNNIIKGTKVRFVDNNMIEKMMTYEGSDRIFNRIYINSFKDDIGIVTGNWYYLTNDVIAVECEFKYNGKFYIYIDCLQIIKKSNIFKRIWNTFYNFLGDIPDIFS